MTVTETATTNLLTREKGDSPQNIGPMTTSDQSHPMEIRSTIGSLLGPKVTIHVGTWNVRTMFAISKTAQVEREMMRYNLDVLGISECRWTGSGQKVTSNGTTILYSGHQDNHIHGVAVMLNKETAKTLMEWEPISDRLIRARFNSKYSRLTIIQCYAPTNEADPEVKDDWYEQLQYTISKVPNMMY